MYEFHLSRHARDRYGLESLAFQSLQQTRGIAAQMKVSAADLYALGLIDEVLRLLLRQYEMQHPGLMGRALDWLDKDITPQSVHKTQVKFVEDFPPAPVYRAEMTSNEYIASESGGIPRRQTSLEELLLLYLHNANAAAMSLSELFDDTSLQEMTVYPSIIEKLHTFFSHQPSAGAGGENLIPLLRAPALASPHSLSGQLEYILNRWGALLGEGFVSRLLRGLDFVKEEIRRSGTGGFAGHAPLPSFGHGEHEYERFSPDKDWMPRLALIAKNSYVWLDQLSKKYQRTITRLDQIPDEELDSLARRGLTGLWLIGLWERSRASQRIKQMMGNADAVASAYSLMDYQIAADLGGWEALGNLRWRAWQRGIRLSADMVPNHMGIDSRWVVEHPDWFLSLPYSPYLAYSFNGPDLSSDQRVGIFLEDHYYDKTDAAVVFQLRNYQNNATKYIYHGNDGTSMPWNDTAQLDFSQAVVREAVIQAILQVARNFPIIRFDAAMTLARKHIQRLWFPEPGAGGAIPSRAEHGMTRVQFEAAIPNEFWREVVDRVAAEVPDTLLLAETFWMMEGYFVRTLGMHRVYNSAFMHMLRDEDNAKYRQVMKNTLEFDPQVLKRYVNFMNNPDEKTASEQFGTTDKYFGVCTLLVTLPGLPMFGHGQIEGFREKYGMEYRRAYWDESVDEGLVRGHEWRIFPLTHRRPIFAEVEDFLLYDFFTLDPHTAGAGGNVNEDVFAYSNRFGVERGLVIYHNKYAETRGWVKTSAAFMDKASGRLVQKSLGQGLGLPDEGYVIFKDYVSGLEYIRPCREIVEKGLYVELGGYQCHVFLDWRFVTTDDGRWTIVCEVLKGAGVPMVQVKFDEMFALRVDVKEEKPKKAAKKRVVEKKVTSRKARSKKRKSE